MKKNGFTLAELLGVIVILAAVALVAFPPIINQIKKSRGELDDALNKLIYSASNQYLEDRNYNLESSSYCIKLSVLVNDGKLVEPITDSKGNVLSLSSIFYIKYPALTESSNITYELHDSDSGLDCTTKIYN